MNEQLQKLALQAGISVEYLTNTKQIVLLEKFAHLLVQEFLTFVRPNSYFQAYPDNMIGGKDGVRLLETITNQIEEHFGVE